LWIERLAVEFRRTKFVEGLQMSAVAQKLITADEYFQMPDPPDGSRDELVKGVIVTMAQPGFRHGEVQTNIAFALKSFLRSHRLGRVTVESGVRTDRDPDSIRGPDVAFWSADRLPLDEKPAGYPQVAADLCVEVRSPSDRMAELRRKAGEYLRTGVRMVWIVEPDDQTVTVYRQPGEGRVFSDDVMLSGEDVLPGFQCRVADFFE
jgi:Uma2 family endonuclease